MAKKNTSHRLVIDTYPLRSLTIGTIRITAHNPRAGGGFCVTRYQTRVQFARSPSALSERRSLNVGLVVVVVGARTPPHRGGADDVVQDMQAAYSLDAPTEARRAPAMSGDQTDPPTHASNSPSNQTQSRAITPGSGPLFKCYAGAAINNHGCASPCLSRWVGARGHGGPGRLDQ